MGLNPIRPGLKAFVNDSVSTAKLELRIPPGAELAVDELVAAQLPAAFKDPDEVAARDAQRRVAADLTTDAVADAVVEAELDDDCEQLPEPGDPSDAEPDSEAKPKRRRA